MQTGRSPNLRTTIYVQPWPRSFLRRRPASFETCTQGRSDFAHMAELLSRYIEGARYMQMELRKEYPVSSLCASKHLFYFGSDVAFHNADLHKLSDYRPKRVHHSYQFLTGHQKSIPSARDGSLRTSELPAQAALTRSMRGLSSNQDCHDERWRVQGHYVHVFLETPM